MIKVESVTFINDRIIIEGYDNLKVISIFEIHSLNFRYEVGHYSICINCDFSITLNECHYTEADARSLFDEIKKKVILSNTPMMKYEGTNPKT